MERYDSYKDSGVEWIGEIPSHWGISRLKYFVLLITEKGSPQASDIRISPENVENGTGRCFNLLSDHFGEGMAFSRGDILFNKLRLYLKKILFCDFEGYSMGEMIVLRTTKGVSRFHYYTFFHQGLIDGLEVLSTGVKLPRVSPDDILNNKHPFPPVDEQERIVEYLDRKTALIDSLIEKTGRKIELLKEKRTSLINEVVTKGLDPDVEMKDSGVEWIGEIPRHWAVSKIKFECEIFGRIGFRGYTTEDIVDEGEGVVTISPSNILNDEFNLKNRTFLSWEKYHESPEIQIFHSDIILVKTGSTIGKTAIIPEGVPEMTINPQLVVLKRIKPLNKYLFAQTTCRFIKESFEIEQTGSTTPTISQEKIKEFPLLLPPLHEQEQIVEYLDEQTAIIDSTITKEEKRIELLKEYRQSLISEVVTGKIRVS
jgi:type I restriction enzyme S subunit